MQTASVCNNQLPYLWNGINLTTAGTYAGFYTNAAGCDSVDTLVLIVNSTSATFQTTSICADQLPYSWNGTNLTSSGTYVNSFVNAAGCDSVSTLVLNVNSLPIVNIQPSNDTIICAGTNYQLSVDSALVSHVWSLNGNNIATGNSLVLDSSGMYLVVCTDTNGCSALDSVNISVMPLPQPIITQSGLTLTCGNVVNVDYQWYFNTNMVGTNDSTLSISANGDYIVWATDSIGCTGIDTFKVSGVGLGEYTYSDHFIELYPNPTNGELSINYIIASNEMVSIDLMDATGKIVKRILPIQQQQAGKHTMLFKINESALAEGVYIVHFNAGGRIQSQRLIYRN